jgi:serine protease Do
MRVLGILAVLVSASPVVAQDATTWAEVGNWTIGIEPSLDNSCFAYSYFDGDTYLAMGYDRRDNTAYADFSDPDWSSLVEGQTYSLSIQFGRRPEWTGDALVSTFTGGDKYLELVVDDEFLNEFAGQNTVRIGFSGKEIAYLNLQGSRRALNAMIDCQNKNAGTADPFAGAATDDPFVGQDAPADDPFAQ